MTLHQKNTTQSWSSNMQVRLRLLGTAFWSAIQIKKENNHIGLFSEYKDLDIENKHISNTTLKNYQYWKLIKKYLQLQEVEIRELILIYLKNNENTNNKNKCNSSWANVYCICRMTLNSGDIDSSICTMVCLKIHQTCFMSCLFKYSSIWQFDARKTNWCKTVTIQIRLQLSRKQLKAKSM